MSVLAVCVFALLVLGLLVFAVVLYNKDNFEGMNGCMAVAYIVIIVFCVCSVHFGQPKAIKCPECGTQVSSEYCPDCGTAATAVVACPNCGESSNTAYCGQCGTKMP